MHWGRRWNKVSRARYPWFSHHSLIYFVAFLLLTVVYSQMFPDVPHILSPAVTLDFTGSWFSQKTLKSLRLTCLLDISRACHPWEPPQGSCPLAILHWCIWNDHAKDADGQTAICNGELLKDPGNWNEGATSQEIVGLSLWLWLSLPVESTGHPLGVTSFLLGVSLASLTPSP